MVTILLFLSLAAFSFKLWKVSKTKKNLNKQIEKLQLELEQKKSNQKNDESYDSLDEDDQQGHHRQKITTMAKKKKHSLEKPQLHLQEEAIKNSQLKMPNKVKEDEISSNFYNYSIAETNYVNYQN